MSLFSMDMGSNSERVAEGTIRVQFSSNKNGFGSQATFKLQNDQNLLGENEMMSVVLRTLDMVCLGKIWQAVKEWRWTTIVEQAFFSSAMGQKRHRSQALNQKTHHRRQWVPQMEDESQETFQVFMHRSGALSDSCLLNECVTFEMWMLVLDDEIEVCMGASDSFRMSHRMDAPSHHCHSLLPPTTSSYPGRSAKRYESSLFDHLRE